MERTKYINFPEWVNTGKLSIRSYAVGDELLKGDKLDLELFDVVAYVRHSTNVIKSTSFIHATGHRTKEMQEVFLILNENK